MRVISAEFVKGAKDVKALPRDATPEVVVIGRSNVGKSTLLNRIFGRKNLARVSATPGKTREINLYNVRIRDGEKKDLLCRFIDLPGYGYAKISAKEREDFGRLIVSYVDKRDNLLAALLLVDSRREIKEEEEAIWSLISQIGYVVLTKVDKISKSEASLAIKRASKALGASEKRIYTAGEGSPITPLIDTIFGP